MSDVELAISEDGTFLYNKETVYITMPAYIGTLDAIEFSLAPIALPCPVCGAQRARPCHWVGLASWHVWLPRWTHSKRVAASQFTIPVGKTFGIGDRFTVERGFLRVELGG